MQQCIVFCLKIVPVFLFMASVCEKLTGPYREGNIFSTSQEIPHILETFKVHYRIYNSPSCVHILSQINPVHAPSHHLLENPIQYFPPIYAYVFQVASFPQFPHQNPVCTSPLPQTCYIPSHLILLNLITQTVSGEQYRSWSFTLCGAVQIMKFHII